MPKILTNYKYDRKKDEFKLLDFDVVFADMPIAVKEMEADYEEILIVPINNVATVVDKKDYLSKNKLFHLKADGDKVIESPDGAAAYLPIDTDISKLRYMNGQLVLEETLTEEQGGE